MASVKTRLFITTLLVLALAVSSCRTKKETTYKPRTTRTTRGDNRTDNSAGDDTNERWKRLDIKLTRHDNRKLYDELRQWLGTPYKYAACDRQKGTDCSGMVMMVYKSVFDIKLERNSAKIYEKNCRHVNKEKLREADLVFFNNGKSGRITHVGIYLKDGYFVHASSSRGVIVSHLTEHYYTTHYQCAGRVIHDN
ncbi:MAG: C40 family peptidase [Muribaculaceae bacterium]|nr:C40 family peptidase [Muribaculaceae bacterium]